jgi:hypothetical protein
MPDPSSPLRIAIRFPSYATARWREGCLASLAAAGHVEITPLEGAEQTDLVIDLSTQALEPRRLTGPRLGYWSVVYGETPERIEPGLQEFIKGARAAYARLVRFDRPDSGTVLREGSVKTVSHSLPATRERLLEAIVDWPGRVLKQQSLEQADAPKATLARIRQRGSLGYLLLGLCVPFAWARNILIRILHEAEREHWAVGVIAEPVQRVCRSFDPTKIRWLPAPPDGLLADPFGRLLPGGTLVIMAEELSWHDGVGRIVTFERLPDGTLTPTRSVFAFPTQASYPQLIEHEGTVYCIPETMAQRCVRLFKADPFPDRWVADTVLLENFSGANATVHFHAGRWWLFVGNNDDQDEAKLFVFHASSLHGPWLPHAANPVKCDLRSARSAGPLFMMNGELYRPAQDCSSTYGGAVVVNRIDRLTPTEFAESPTIRLAPAARGPYPHGLHTLSAAGELTLIDGKRHVFSPRLLVRRAWCFGQKLAASRLKKSAR